jgi:hypothetical protein
MSCLRNPAPLPAAGKLPAAHRSFLKAEELGALLARLEATLRVR